MNSAFARTSASVTVVPKQSQLFQPMGGVVRASGMVSLHRVRGRARRGAADDATGILTLEETGDRMARARSTLDGWRRSNAIPSSCSRSAK
ncbi:hypothetical protein GCM10017576_27350 [Microbacterium barkeri]|uniref:Uncharacterized protein n=1 Tax=Microbacterium barkeri TaxID=33917 RepID=A0A9W6LX88_9MICO|nr:hypothetical protein GCM10017576_27350 [Microbacterium barkeri]